MHDIFISYSRQDRDFADRLYRELQRFRVSGFMDVSDIAAGADFSRRISDAVKNADAILVVLSEAAAQSSYVMAEIGMAQSMEKIIIPVLAPKQNYESSVPPMLLDQMVIDAGSASIELVAANVVSAITKTPVEVSLSEVQSRASRRQRLLSVITGLFLVLSVTATWMAMLAQEQKYVAEERRERIELLTGGSVSMALAPDGRRLATGSRDGTIRIWDMNSGQTLAILRHEDSVSSLAFSPDGRLIASASWNGVVSIWDDSTGNILMRLVGHSDSVTDVQFMPDGNTILSRSLDGTVREWEIQSGKQIRVLKVSE